MNVRIDRRLPSTERAGGITAWIDYGNWTEKAPFTIIGDKEVWPTADRIA
jgi:hypothetical protein